MRTRLVKKVRCAVVTGSSGFIGSHLVERLNSDGVSVVGLDSSPPKIPNPTGTQFLGVDVRDYDSVTGALSEVQPEVVFHLAGQPSPAVSMRDPIVDIELNVLGTVNVARAAVSLGVQRFVFFSTGGAMYGEPERLPVDDDTPPAPHSVYGASKLAAEHYLRVLAQHGGLEVSVLRPGHVYGSNAREGPDGEYEEQVANFAWRMIRDEPVQIVGDGSQRLDYVGHVP